MSKLFKYLRTITIINMPIRWLLKIIIKFSAHWPVSGLIELEFDKIKFKLYSRCDDGFADIFYYENKYSDELLLKLFIFLSKKNKIIIDIGALTGVYSILASKANPLAEIIAFEPYHINALRANKNTYANNCGNIRIHEYAIGNNNELLSFYVPSNETIIDTSSFNESHSKSIYPELKWKATKVQQITLDAFANSFLKEKQIDVIKIDVEDHELEVFEGMEQIIAAYKPEIFFESFLTNEKINYFNTIKEKYNYFLYVIMTDRIILINDLKTMHGMNFLFSKDKNLENAIKYG